MAPSTSSLGAAEPLQSPPERKSQAGLSALPPTVGAAVWRGTELRQQAQAAIASGWEALDAELPCGGWPRQSITEILTTQPSTVEWRLLGSALRHVVAAGGQIAVIAPPRQPYLPGLAHEGLEERQFVWIQAEAPAERLWVTEQLIKANAAGALIAWLPQAREEQVRRLQVCAQSCEGLVFLCRPDSAQHEVSAAPLRVQATFGFDWELQVHVFKRRGPPHDGIVRLPSIPGGLSAVLTPRLLKPSRLFQCEVAADVVGSTVVPLQSRRHATAH